MHGVPLYGLALDRQESSRTHMQADILAVQPLLLEPGKNLRGKMQPGGRRGDRAPVGGIKRLIPLTVNTF